MTTQPTGKRSLLPGATGITDGARPLTSFRTAGLEDGIRVFVSGSTNAWFRYDQASVATADNFYVVEGEGTGRFMREGEMIPYGAATVENGFVDRTLSTLSFDDGTRTLSIQPTGANFVYYAGGKRFVSTGATKQIPDAEGLHFFYFDAAGVLQTTQAFVEAIITDYGYVAGVFWDADNNLSLLVAEERHGREMSAAVHSYLHNTAHTRWQEGLGPNSVVTEGSGDLAAHAQIGVDAGVIWDEDIRHAVGAQAAPASIPFFYRSGAAGNWRKINGTGYVVTTTGSGRAAYNQFTGGVWQLTEVASSNFLLMHLLATNTVGSNKFIWVLGQVEYATVAQARVGATQEWRDITLGSLGALRNLSHEFVMIGSFIIQTANTYANAVKSRIRLTDLGDPYIDWRGQFFP